MANSTNDNPNVDPQDSGDRPDNASPLKWLLVAVVAVALAAIAGSALFNTASGTDEAAAGIRSHSFTTADGGTDTLAAYDGQPLVVNFFAAWCPPCLAELPEFQAVHEAFDGEVTFVGVSHDFDEAQWRGLVETTGITFDTVFQPGQEIWTEVGGIGMPTTLFVSPDGEVLEMHTGILNEEQLTELVDEHLT